MSKSIIATLLIIESLQISAVHADGGTLQLSRTSGEFRISVFSSPAVPRVGTVDVSVLLQDTTGTTRTDVPITVRLEPLADQGIPQEAVATSAVATNRLFQAAQFDLAQPGPWRVSVAVGSQNPANLSFDWEIAPAFPSWLQLLPWLSWPFVAMGLFLVHHWLADHRKKRGTDP